MHLVDWNLFLPGIIGENAISTETCVIRKLFSVYPLLVGYETLN